MRLLVFVFLLAYLPAVHAADWQLYTSNDQVSIYFKYEPCHDEANGLHQEKVFFKFENKTTKRLAIDFSRQSFYTQTRTNGDPAKFQLLLNGFERREGNCTDRENALVCFSKHLNKPSVRQLIKFDLHIISLQEVK